MDDLPSDETTRSRRRRLAPHLTLRAATFGRPVCRLGLATRGGSGLVPDDVFHAIDQGIDFLNWPGLAEGPDGGDAISTAVASLGARRQEVVVCAQFGARTASEAADELRGVLTSLKSDYVDILTLYYVEHADEWDELIAPGGVLRYLEDARRDGVVRKIGVTSHQRPLARAMVESGRLDVLMIRYNAAHRGAETEIFPAAQAANVPILAYTALRWGALLRPTPDDPPGFVVPGAATWYRFVLQSPAVAIALAAPDDRAELNEDLQVLRSQGPLTSDEWNQLAEHGARVRRHGGAFP
jgi:aryl-alcohol dehydrogenase-like predicted oxidoreductase